MARLLAFAAGVLCLAACGGDDFDPDEPPPVLTVTPVDMAGAYNAGQMRQGDVRFEGPVLLPFGTALPSGPSPAIEYIAVPDAPVRACSPGRIMQILTNEGQGDFEVHIQPHENSRWLLIYDHVLAVSVTEGQDVAAGAPLGTAGNWSATGRRTELQINDLANSVSVCPLSLGDAAFRDAHEALRQTIVAEGFGPLDDVCLFDQVTQ